MSRIHSANSRRKRLRNASAVLALIVLGTLQVFAQCAPAQEVASTPPTINDWERAAGGKMSFEVASVHAAKSTAEPTSSFPLGPGNAYAAIGGRFCATGTTILSYISFAYKLSNQQLQSLTSAVPDWVTTDRFDIEAKGPANASKDQMRLMMQALLTERFRLAVHHEFRQSPAFAVLSVKSGKVGPQLQYHGSSDPCAPSGTPASRPQSGGTVQLQQLACGGILSLVPSAEGRVRIGARDIPIALFAAWMTNRFTDVQRPVFDRTGLTGNFDFWLEFSIAANALPPGLTPDSTAPSFMQALQEQLGLKLESITAPVDVVLVDHVEHPAEN